MAAWAALLGTLALTAASPRESRACTSAIVSGAITRDGRPILWKHRDTSAGHNFMARVEGREGRHGNAVYLRIESVKKADMAFQML